MYCMPVPNEASLKRPSARTLVYNCLREWIEQGVLAPGEVIRDVEIASKLSVSRTPVREALQLLEQIGAIETAPNYQTRVADVHPDAARLVYPPLTALLVVAAETALPDMAAEDIEALTSANERMLAAVKRRDTIGSREADEAFHGVFAERAQNPFLTAAIDALRIHVRRLETMYFSHLSPSLASYREHEAIIEITKRGDAPELRTAILAHYDRAVGAMLEHVTASAAEPKPRPRARASKQAARTTTRRPAAKR